MLDESRLEHRMIDVGGVRLHTVLCGPETGRPVVLLHGFPETWWSWRHLIPVLADAGFRVIAPDQRGYNLSDCPTAVADYRIPLLVEDIRGLLDALQIPKARIVGHDWGAHVAWVFAMTHGDRLERLAILNVPHPKRMRDALRTWKQAKRSWYMVMFQIPGVTEWLLRRNDFALMKQYMWRGVRPDAFDAEDIARYVEAFSRPGALTGALDWYRAGARDFANTFPVRPIDRPTLVLWGERDIALHPDLADPPPDLVPDCKVIRLPDASHWVQHDEPERVKAEILAFLEAP
jgi:pimeloyl-ACP methyl ester carboxylesterase